MVERFIREVQERVHGMYLAIYQSLQYYSAESVDEYFLRAGIPLDSEEANNPTMRRRAQMFITVDKFLANLIAIPLGILIGLYLYLYYD